MRRRDFMKYGLLGGAAALAPRALASSVRAQQLIDSGSAGPQGRAAPQGVTASVDLEEITVVDLQRLMESGELTARSLAEMYLRRIEEIDSAGPMLNSVLEINPDALAIADALDEERAARGPRGPLHGVPVMIKDNIDTADRMMTTAGSLALQGSTPSRDSFVAERLREAGAVILAKTNLSEWANFRSTRSSSGWSGRGGQTRNPFALDRSPCGSSSGSGAAVSGNLCALAIGTETDGSVVCPSSANGVVGIKPTVGLVSRAGIIPIAHSQDTAGPMARTVADAATLLGALTGVDSRDLATSQSRGRALTDYTRFLDPNGLRGARIGVARNFFGFHERVDALMEEAIATLDRGGATIIDNANLDNTDDYGESEFEVLLYEFKADLDFYLESLGPGAPVHSLADVIAFNEAHRDREMPYFGQEIFLLAEEKGPLTDQEYLDALDNNHRLSRDEGIDKVMNEHELHAIIAPTDGPAWPIDLITGDHFLGGSSTPAAVSGYPSITVPAGYVFGLPVGISFFGRAWSEPTLLRLAFAYERSSRHRQAPRFLPTADLSVS
jgi:amidase